VDTTSDSERESIHDQIRQAFGSSENREALASLSGDGSGEEEAAENPADDVRSAAFLDELPEVQPVVPPPPEEAFDPAEAEVQEETTFEVPPVEPPPEPVVEPVEEPIEDVDVESAETVVDEFVKMDPIIAEPPVPDEPEEPEEVEPEVEEPVEGPADEPADEPPPAGATFDKTQPIMFGLGEPFGSDDDGAIAEVLPPETPIVPTGSAIDVTAQDNQLHVQLKGSGAIAEMGQVRALDIEVPVPGQWVGNRKVTLQLRLTLTPAEDENG
jgi:hypothetical protein